MQDLKKGTVAIEERARTDLGMVGKGETFYQVVDAQGSSPLASSASRTKMPRPSLKPARRRRTTSRVAPEVSAVDSRFWVIVPAAGSARRMGAAVPKQYLPLAGRTVIEWSLAPFLERPQHRRRGGGAR